MFDVELLKSITIFRVTRSTIMRL